jgi:NADPH:quinone reductase-like Zn-dependent oxidoreductase
VLDVVDLPDPVPGDGQQLFDVATAGVNYADTHHRCPERHIACSIGTGQWRVGR